jgi:hypothetical protein
MPECCRQDQKLVPFVTKVVEKVSKMLHRLLQGRQHTKPQMLALSKYMQAGPGAYKPMAAMVKDRGPPGTPCRRKSKSLATNNTTTTTTAAPTWPCTKNTTRGTS